MGQLDLHDPDGSVVGTTAIYIMHVCVAVLTGIETIT